MEDSDMSEPSIVDAARALGRRVYAEAYGALDRGVDRLGGAGGRVGGVGERTSGAGALGDLLERVGLSSGIGGMARAGSGNDLATLVHDVAQVVLHTATTAGEAILDGARALEQLLDETGGGAGGGAGGGGTGSDGTPAGAGLGAPVALALPATSPGETASGSFRVHNDSLDTVDALRFRCGGLFGPGDLRITPARIRFDPPVVDVAPDGDAVATCVVAVPKSAKLGHYTGLVEAAGLSGVQLLVTLDVL
jgi:hypothetical protein